jgi:phosphoribosylformylglycinamidine cyclo-ligase
MSLYAQRGVSAQKEEVHQATEKLDKGLFAHAFCKIYPDYLCGDPGWVNTMHADGAGTKSILAYLYWKETGDLSVWKGIARDAIAMNLDDLLCVGIYDNLLFSSTIDRNLKNIPGDVLAAIINGTQEFFNELESHGVRVRYLGGETADVGDLVRTIAVNGTMTARWPKDRLISNDRIAPGDVIVGLASFGQANYETDYNSGIGSNGLTSARHDTLEKTYAARYPESFDNQLEDKVVYIGSHLLTDPIDIPAPIGPAAAFGPSPQSPSTPKPTPGSSTNSPAPGPSTNSPLTNAPPTNSPAPGPSTPPPTGWSTDIGHLLLSPTRTYAPVLKRLLTEKFDDIHGLIHCSGGGQTKCMKYLPGDFRVVKDNLFDPPPIFRLIQKASGSDAREMYQVFNMGHRLEIFTTPAAADELISISQSFGIEARIVGRVERAPKKSLILKTTSGEDILFDL